ncbi:MAG: response regulator transcription factor [Desulfobacterales bacterium]|jgi:DNA-binding NarL/FixJ family response regulator
METQIFILGPRRLQNSLIARYLEQTAGLGCLCCSSRDEVPVEHLNSPNPSRLILWDCRGRPLSECLPDLEAERAGLFRSCYALLFNLEPGSALEEPAMKLGVKGFLYREDPIEVFSKAIEAVFKGELWVSREVLTQSFLRARDGGHLPPLKTNPLTPRETEILVLVSAGAKNEQIAEELHISPNTVKTHIYNIFKKISVPNRLQAALWAVKNL